MIGIYVLNSLYKALKEARSCLSMCYSGAEDNANNPPMQSIGHAMAQADAALFKAELGTVDLETRERNRRRILRRLLK